MKRCLQCQGMFPRVGSRVYCPECLALLKKPLWLNRPVLRPFPVVKP